MRLIDADYLKNILNNGGSESVNINISKSMSLGDIVDTVIMAYRKCLFAELEKVPTAYDLDKVVNGLNEMIEDNVDMDTGERCENWVVDMCNDLVLKCGEVVKSGLKV